MSDSTGGSPSARASAAPAASLRPSLRPHAPLSRNNSPIALPLHLRLQCKGLAGGPWHRAPTPAGPLPFRPLLLPAVLVVDSGNHRVAKYNITGSLIGYIGKNKKGG